jgi:alpha-L-fucosidase
MKTFLPIVWLAGLLALLPQSLKAETAPERDNRMRWWREARLGMFVHWGLYSGAEGIWDGQKYGGGVEWIQNQAGVPTAEYAARMRPLFKPNPGFARSQGDGRPIRRVHQQAP